MPMTFNPLALDMALDMTIGAFISDARDSGDIEIRWLGAHMVEVLDLVRRVSNTLQGKPGGLTDDETRAVGVFRIGEIRLAKQGLAEQVHRLSAEESSILGALAPLPEPAASPAEFLDPDYFAEVSEEIRE